MAKIRLEIDTRELKKLERFAKKAQAQLPFAASKALNSLAFETRDKVRGSMPSNFTIRRPWVTRQIEVKQRADKRNLEAVLGTSQAGRFLAKHEDGGTRPALGRYIAIPTRAVRRTKTDQIRKSDRPASLGARASVIDYRGNHWLALNRARKGNSLRLVYLLKPQAKIDERLQLHEQGQSVIRQQGSKALREALDYALKTAK
jgi:hypothetical protein